MPAPRTRLQILAAITVVVCLLFMTVALRGKLSYVLSYRGQVIATMILVGMAAGMSTVLFQTLTRNHILTPSIMGFESLFLLLQTGVIFFRGANGLADWPPMQRFAVEALMMVTFATLLYRWMFRKGQNDLYRLLLAGLVFGILFRSVAELMQRMLAPGEFNVLQGRMFAQLTLPGGELIIVAAVLMLGAAVALWRHRREFDVIALGRAPAIALGVNYERAVTRSLVLISVLVATSTALIGPLTFLGFVAATLTYQLAGTVRHAVMLPFAAMVGVVALAGGQLVLEHVFGMTGTLSVIIEFVGGGLFLLLLVRKGKA